LCVWRVDDGEQRKEKRREEKRREERDRDR
jgi:hypothetical protein